MKAILFPSPGKVAFTTLPDPTPGPGEALVAVRASGICHTDIDVLHARYGPGAFPIVPGHEYAGEVIAVGGGVETIRIGDRVVIDPNISCNSCRACARGRRNLCEDLGAYGVTVHGGFAELSAVHAGNLVRIGDMPFALAALAEPIGCVLNGIGAVPVGAGDDVLIFGAGPIGLLIGMALTTRGVTRITFADVNEARLGLAETFGYNVVSAHSADLQKFQRNMDLTVDATGNPGVAASLTRYTTNGGACLFFGVCPPDRTIEISPFEIFRRQLTLAGTHSLNHNIPEAIATIKAIGPSLGNLISHRMPMADIAQVLTGASPNGSLKIQSCAC